MRNLCVQLAYLVFVSLMVLPSGCALYGELEQIEKVDSEVPEASGLAILNDTLYVVSDKNGDIYKLDTNGKEFDRLKTKTKDVEGITWCNGKIYLADEAKQKIYAYSAKGDRIENFQIKYPKFYDTQNGLEGITYDKYSNQFFVLNEKNPGLILQFDTTFVFKNQIFLGSFGDYSGIATTKDHIWIISDEGAGLAKYDREMNLIKIYSLGIDSPEGIAISEENQRIYVVSDSSSELVIFEIPKTKRRIN